MKKDISIKCQTFENNDQNFKSLVIQYDVSSSSKISNSFIQTVSTQIQCDNIRKKQTQQHNTRHIDLQGINLEVKRRGRSFQLKCNEEQLNEIQQRRFSGIDQLSQKILLFNLKYPNSYIHQHQMNKEKLAQRNWRRKTLFIRIKQKRDSLLKDSMLDEQNEIQSPVSSDNLSTQYLTELVGSSDSLQYYNSNPITEQQINSQSVEKLNTFVANTSGTSQETLIESTINQQNPITIYNRNNKSHRLTVKSKFYVLTEIQSPNKILTNNYYPSQPSENRLKASISLNHFPIIQNYSFLKKQKRISQLNPLNKYAICQTYRKYLTHLNLQNLIQQTVSEQNRYF